MGATIVRIYAMHEPLKAFFYFSVPFFLIGIPVIVRFLWLSVTEHNGSIGHVQSLMLGSASTIIGVLIMLIGLIADLISNNRRLIEDTLFRVKKMELELDKQKNREDSLLGELRQLRSDLTGTRLPAHPTNGLGTGHAPPKAGPPHPITRIEEIEVESVKVDK
jgi:hypothetical protein